MASDHSNPTYAARMADGAAPALLAELPEISSAFRLPSPWGVVVLLTVLAAALRFIGIGAESFWKNELFSVYWSQNPFDFLLTKGLATETNPPLYFVLLKLWMGLFGSSEAAVRSLSALASAACIPLAYLFGADLGRKTSIGLIAATLLALSPVQLYFAHEARVYAFLPLFILITLTGLQRYLRTPDVRAFNPERGVASSLDIYAIGAIALLYSHATAAIALLALFITTLLYFAEVRAPRSQVVGFVLANVIVALLASPAIMALALQAESPNLAWIPPTSIGSLLAALRYLMIAPMVRFDVAGAMRAELSWIELGVALAALIVLAVQVRQVVRDRLALALLVLFPVLFLTLVFGISAFRPILVPRITVWLAIPVALIAAFVFTSTRFRILRFVAMGLMAGCTVLGLNDTSFAPAPHNPDWRGFVAAARPSMSGDTLYVVGPHAGPLGISRYGEPAMAQHVRQWRPAPLRHETNADWLERTVSGDRPINTAQLGAAIRSGAPVLLIFDSDDESLIPRLAAQLPEFARAIRHDYPALTVFTWPPSGRTP